MDRKEFFRSTAGIAIAGIFGKSVIESLETEKSDAEKMLNGAKAIDEHFKQETSMIELLKEVMYEDKTGNCYLNVKTE